MRDFFEDRPSFKNLIGKYDLIGVEIGVDSGENAFNLLTNLSIKKLYLIDPWYGYADLDGHGVIGDDENAERCYQHTFTIMKPFGDKVEIIRALSESVASVIPNTLDFLYIDGNHRYPWVIKDIRNYAPKVREGGQVAGHDMKSGEPGVEKAVREYYGDSFNQREWDWWHIKEIMNDPNE